jgi:hypothetical protein
VAGEYGIGTLFPLALVPLPLVALLLLPLLMPLMLPLVAEPLVPLAVAHIDMDSDVADELVVAKADADSGTAGMA